MKHIRLLLVFCLFLFSACSDTGLRNRDKGVLGGAALGAGIGAIIGAATGDAGVGTAIGGGVGALAGGVLGNEMDKDEARQADIENRLDDRDRMISENQQIIDELKRRGADARISDRGVVVNLPDVLFEFDSSKLTSGAQDTVYDIVQVLRDVSDRHIAVEGHTDSIGTISYNQRLSEERANSVASALVREGVSRRRISTRGFGETDPIASNRTDSGRARNRRVEVIIENSSPR
ncbi:MAG: OmpA family protein [Bdellovibrionales bacterium]|nr:OmpA family protein [Bdellovibrionales bacterium]